MPQAEECLRLEEERVDNYLHASTKPKLLKQVRVCFAAVISPSRPVAQADVSIWCVSEVVCMPAACRAHPCGYVGRWRTNDVLGKYEHELLPVRVHVRAHSHVSIVPMFMFMFMCAGGGGGAAQV